MTSDMNFLDSDPNLFEKNLRFVKNEVEEELDQIFGTVEPSTVKNSAPLDYKIVKPEPGMCIKCFKVNTKEKFFINLCQTNGILAPEDITENELQDILQSGRPSSYRVPMSVSAPRITKDKSGKNVDVCDIAINPEFFKKCQRTIMFRDFCIAIILEAISEKYNIQVSPNDWIILKNRKLMGTLVQHRIQNRDIKRVYDSYNDPSKLKDNQLMKDILDNDKKLIEEISAKEKQQLLNKTKDNTHISQSSVPAFRLYGKQKNSVIYEIVGEFYLPECISANEVDLDVGEDRVFLESLKRKYLFYKFINYSIDRDQVKASFNPTTKILEIRMPLNESGKKVD